MAQNTLFIVSFLTAFLWAGIPAIYLYKKNTRWSRFAAVPLGFLAVQSIFWLVICTAGQLFSFTDSGFAQTWMWLMGGSAIIWWISSALGLFAGMIHEYREYGDGYGIWVAIGITLLGMVLYAFYLLMAWVVTSIQGFPVNLG